MTTKKAASKKSARGKKKDEQDETLPRKPGVRAVTENKTVRYYEETPEADDDEDTAREFGEDDDDDGDEDVPLTPLQVLLSSIQSADFGNVTIYVRRKPDPVNLRGRFRTPCDIEATKGQLPFEDSFVDKETIELAVQRVFDGGYFQLQIRRSGTVLHTWSAVIEDLPQAQQPTAQPSATSDTTAQPDRFRTLFEKSFERHFDRLFEQVTNSVQSTTTAPPDPVAALLAEHAKNNPALAERLIDRYLKSEEGEAVSSSWVGDMLRHPSETAQLFGMLQSYLRPAGAGGAGAPNAQQQTQPDPVAAMLEPHRALIEGVCVALVNDADTAPIAVALRRKAAEDKTLAGYLRVLVEMSSVEVLQQLARFTGQTILLKLRHAADWIQGLQDALTAAPPTVTDQAASAPAKSQPAPSKK